ncbi:putative type-1 restriction enzyme specificity protein [compost metagenome]
MINPNSIDKLLDGVEVEWKPLGEVGKFTRGKRFVKTDMLSEGFPCIHYGEMYTHYNIWANTPKSFLSHDLAAKLRVANHGDVVIVAAGETIEDIGNGTAWLGNTGVVIHDACFSYRSSLNPKYVSYFLRTKHFHDQIKKHISTGKISAINETGLRKAKIPIPPPEVQEEIVRILDAFTELTAKLTAELTAELTARKKQYEYYRNRFFEDLIDSGVQKKKIGDFCDLLTGNPFDSSQFTETGTRLMRGMNIKRGVLDFSENNNRYWKNDDGLEKYHLRADDIVISMDGSLVGKSYGMVSEKQIPLLLVQRVARIRTEQANSHYVYHYIASGAFSNYVDLKKTGGAIPHISLKDIANFTIPMPDIQTQDKIALFLDHFDTLVNDITEGLPREIEMRQRQYEYYRDMLLSFPKSEVEA